MHSKEGFFVGHKKKKGLGLFGGMKYKRAIICRLQQQQTRGLFLEVI